MMYLFQNNQGFFKPNFIFKNGGPKAAAEKFEPKKAREAFEKAFFKEIPNLTKEMSPEDVLEVIEGTFKENFSPEKYEEEFRSFIEKQMPEGTSPEVIERLAKDSRYHYEKEYNAAMARFYRATENKLDKYEDLKDEIQSGAKKALDKLLGAVEDAIRAEKVKPKIEKVVPKAEKATWIHKIPVIGRPLEKGVPILSYPTYSSEYREYVDYQRKTAEQFKDFLSATNDKYFNLDLQKARLSEKNFDLYEDLVNDFKDGMDEWLKNQLEFIFEIGYTPETLKKNLEGLRNDLTARYRKYDVNKDGFINLPELQRLKKLSKRYVDVITLINSGASVESITKKAEYKEFFNRNRWIEATEILTEQLIEDVTNNGSEAEFIAVAQKMSGSKEKMSFDEAKDVFEDIMEKRAETGIKETIQAIREFNNAVNSGQIKIFNEIKPDSIKPLVLGYGGKMGERDLLIRRIHIPRNIDDRLVVEFMSTNLEGRNMILSHPVRRQALFQAIKNIQKREKSREFKNKIRGLPRKTSELTSTKGDPERRPTGHDRLARSLALITLAKEAEWVIKNLDQSENYAEEDLVAGLEATQAEKHPPSPDTNFRSIHKLYSTRYITEAARGGFNGRDLLLTTGKVLIGMTILANVMNARRKGLKGIGEALTNPYLYAGVGAIYGIKKYQENPEAKNYLFESPGGQERIATHFHLNSLAKKAGRNRLLAFIHNADEFKAMEEVFKDPKRGINKIKRVLKKARERYSPYPTITKNDLRDVIADDAVWFPLPERGNNRTRYLFYEKFLSSPRNIRQLQDSCKKWM